jgi:hypothetical protein
MTADRADASLKLSDHARFYPASRQQEEIIAWICDVIILGSISSERIQKVFSCLVMNAAMYLRRHMIIHDSNSNA